MVSNGYALEKDRGFITSQRSTSSHHPSLYQLPLGA
jgi:hypothetical protein